MFCAECGLEIRGKRYSNGGDDLCSDCHVRQTKKAVLHKSVESEALSNQSRANASGSVASQSIGTVTRNNNPFTSEDTYIEQVHALRNKIALPKLALIGLVFFVSTSLFASLSQVFMAALFLLASLLALFILYLKFYRYTPDYDNLVIVEGILKTRYLRPKNDDRNYTLTKLRNNKNMNLLKINGQSEVHLRGLSQECKPYVDKEMLFYVDSHLQMILACKSID